MQVRLTTHVKKVVVFNIATLQVGGWGWVGLDVTGLDRVELSWWIVSSE
jgi:hypothetical protein